ncbi:MAG: hypothetical protein KDI92_09175 [Xanthomonadales bacterium]|nr:hypothetical protein [Xanthomonadales bacterium]
MSLNHCRTRGGSGVSGRRYFAGLFVPVNGIHVHVEVPEMLKNSGKLYFSKPGEQYLLQHTHPEEERNQ